MAATEKKKAAHSNHSLLTNAIQDLYAQIKLLQKEKESFKGLLRKVSSAIDVDRDQEKKLQQKLATLLDEEASLNSKKRSIKDKIEAVTEKLNKVYRIKSEMSDL